MQLTKKPKSRPKEREVAWGTEDKMLEELKAFVDLIQNKCTKWITGRAGCVNYLCSGFDPEIMLRSFKGLSITFPCIKKIRPSARPRVTISAMGS